MAKIETYKGKSATDLKKALVAKRTELRNFRFGAAGSKSRNVKEGKSARKDIARILTELRSQTLGAQK